MVREFSAGGVVLRRISGEWQIAAIEPEKEGSEPAGGRRRMPRKVVLALPKGLVDEGEKPEQTALREVREETGVTATLIAKLADIRYVYVRSWGDQERVFKIVSFYLLRYQSGRIDDVTPDMRVEVRRALWLPLEDAPAKLAYNGERQVVRKAQEYLKSHPEVLPQHADHSAHRKALHRRPVCSRCRYRYGRWPHRAFRACSGIVGCC